jgi:hypothetical protein
VNDDREYKGDEAGTNFYPRNMSAEDQAAYDEASSGLDLSDEIRLIRTVMFGLSKDPQGNALDVDFFYRAVGNFRAVPIDRTVALARLHDDSKTVSEGWRFASQLAQIAAKMIERSEDYPRFHIVPSRGDLHIFG